MTSYVTEVSEMDTEQEIAEVSTAIAAQPNDATLYVKRGKLYASLKRYDAAIADYDTAIALNPNYGRAYTNRANAYTATGRFVEALRDVEKALSLL